MNVLENHNFFDYHNNYDLKLYINKPIYLVICGAALRGYYTSGMCNIINNIIDSHNIKGIYVSSSGCLTSIGMTIGYTPIEFERDYQKVRSIFNSPDSF